jgi:hypothetical protein
MNSFFAHPYYYSSSLLAKLAVNGASALWAAIVLLAPAHAKEVVVPLRLRELLALIHAPTPLENIIAGVLLLVCSVLVYCLLSHRRPKPVGGIAYTTLASFWVYGAAATWTADGPTPAAAAAAITTVAAISLFALVANPKRDASSR